MNKTVTINISGFVFHIEDSAYEVLKRYLESIKGTFRQSEGRDEIIADIEARIAEIFREKISDAKEVIVKKDVEEMISIMGEPEAFAETDEEPQSATHHASGDSSRSRRIFRDPDNKVIGGVCGGAGAYFNIDPLWLRLAFAVSFFVFGTGFLFYFILWIIIPEAKTTAEKLEMRGESVNVSNIEKTIREEMDNLKKKIEDNVNSDGFRKGRDRAKTGIEKLFGFFGNFIILFFKGIGKLLGVFFMLLGIGLLISFVASMFGSQFLFWDMCNGDGNCHLHGFEWHDLKNTFLPAGWQSPAALLAVALLIVTPILGLIAGGIRLLFGVRLISRGVGVVVSGLIIIGVILSFAVVTRSMVEFKHDAEAVDIVPVSLPGDTLYLDVARDHFKMSEWDRYHPEYFEFVEFDGDKVFMGALSLDIRASFDDSVSIEVVSTARGRTRGEAYENVKDIEYAFSIKDSLILFDPFFTFSREVPWRVQQVEVVVRLPEGVVVDLSHKMDRIIYDVKNTTRTFDRDMVGHRWKMTKEGLQCIDCEVKPRRREETKVITEAVDLKNI